MTEPYHRVTAYVRMPAAYTFSLIFKHGRHASSQCGIVWHGHKCPKSSCFWKSICQICTRVQLSRLRLQPNKLSLTPFSELLTRLLKTPSTFKPEDTLKLTSSTLKLLLTPPRFLTEVLVQSPNKTLNTSQKVWNMLMNNFHSLTHKNLLLNTSSIKDWTPWRMTPTTSYSLV